MKRLLQSNYGMFQASSYNYYYLFFISIDRAPLKTYKTGVCGIFKMISLPANNYFNSNCFLMSFKNGCVGLYNFDKNKMEFFSEEMHSETVFDLQFSNINKDILASASYDGNVKIWNVHQMKCISTLTSPSNDAKYNPVYGISWSPDSNEVVTVHSKGEIILWDCEKGKMLSSLRPGKSQIFRVDWNKLSSNLIASGSAEGCA